MPLTYRVDWACGLNDNCTDEVSAKDRPDAQRKARRISKKLGKCFVVAYEGDKSVGHIPYYDGYQYPAGIEGRV